ncbi:hypothetical protein Tco_0521588, partial [Tanacetum coccineum]
IAELRGVLHGELTLARATAIRGGRCLEEAGGLDEAAEGNDLCSSKNRNPQTTLYLQSLQNFRKRTAAMICDDASHPSQIIPTSNN